MFEILKKQMKLFAQSKSFFYLNLLAFVVLLYSSSSAQATGFDAETYINTGFLIFFIYVIVMTIIFLIGQNKKPEEEKEMVSKLDRMLNDAKPIEEEHSLLMDHNYDGIRELDNNLPPWWKYLFYATILFGVVYLGYYHLSNGPGSIEEYDQEIRQAQIALAATQGTTSVNLDNVKLLTDAPSLAKGKAIFEKNCVSCHGTKAEGIVGPNLTDDYWINGGTVKEIYITISNGVLPKGMQSWKALLNPQDIEAVLSFIKSLRGSNPPNAKAPQGELFKEQPAADTTKTVTPKSDSAKVDKKVPVKK
jgi:cytochrome c oxidase cbb3-type subunit 3